MQFWLPDFSHWNGKPDFEILKKIIPACIVRTGYGDDIKSQDDVYAAYNLKECNRLGIPVAGYLYSYADSDAHLYSEIAHEKRVTKGFNVLAHILDIEEWKNNRYVKRACKLWLEAFPENGIVYAGKAYWNGPMKGLQCMRWVPAYGTNNGKRQKEFEPNIEKVGWQFTSRYHLQGVNGNVDMSEWYGFPFVGIKPIEIKKTRRVVTKKEVAALIMKHYCIHDRHGYTQDMALRNGGKETETIDIYGKKYTIPAGDFDCSAAVINSYEAAGISCGGATYTGNMRQCMVKSKNFAWRSMNFIAQMGDSYLNEKHHTAMCLSAEPDVLMEFSINEKGTATGGKPGDQLQKGEYDQAYGRGESHLKLYYDYPWNGILQCINEEIAFIVEADGTITAPSKDDGFTAGGEKDVEIVKPEKTDTDLAVEILFDVHGSGDKRRKALGGRYDAAQKEAQRLWNSPHERTQAEKAYFKKFGCKDLI